MLDDELSDAAGKAEGFGRIFFRSEYKNLVLAGMSTAGDVALIAGTHSKDFPYWGTEPWDTGLLRVGGDAYHFTQRQNGVALEIAVDVASAASTGVVRYKGQRLRASDGEPVQVELDLPVVVKGFPAMQLGKKYDFLDVEESPRPSLPSSLFRC